MTHDWFHHREIPSVGSIAELDEAEARHAMGARRLAPGEIVTLFDGRGVVADAVIEHAGRKRAALRVLKRTQIEPPIRCVTLAAALPKGDRQSVLFSMAAQLGMQRFIPLLCERSVAQPVKGFASRTERILIEACKQSRQAFLPVIEPPDTAANIAAIAAAQHELVLLAHPGGAPLGSVRFAGSRCTIMVGPEGGFTDEERLACQRHGASVISLGESILRTETAAVALLAWARFAPAAT